jgi:hypothetical protein
LLRVPPPKRATLFLENEEVSHLYEG